jgi:hypothetical protein
VGKPEGKRPLGRPRRRETDNTEMGLWEIDWGGTGWIDLAQDSDQWRALVNKVINFRFSQNIMKFLSTTQLAASQEGLTSMKLDSCLVLKTQV